MDLDDVIDKFSLFGRYHLMAEIMLILNNVATEMASLNYIFIAEEVKYNEAHCPATLYKPTLPSLDRTVDIEYVLHMFSIFGRYHLLAQFQLFTLSAVVEMSCVNFIMIVPSVNYRCIDNENATCSSFNSSNRCSGWIYDEPHSFMAEFDLACQEWKRTLVGTIHSLGYMVGLILVGPISDRIGRKKAIIMTSIASGVSGVARSFANSYWLYIAFEFLEAMLGDSFSPIFMMAVEIVSTKKRVPFLTVNAMGYPAGGATLALIAWLFPYWRNTLRMIYAPAFIFILYYFLLDESPRWLLANGRKEEAIAIIKKAAKTNKMHIDDDVLEKLEYQKQETVNFVEVLKSTFQSKTLLKRFFVCVVWWTTSTFVNYGMTINSVSLQGNKYLNFGILFLIEIPGILINMCVLKYLKRKYSLILYFFIGAVLCLIQPFVPLHLSGLAVALYMIGKLMSMFYFDTTYLYTSELFPTYTRNSMHALCSSIGRIGSIIAPQTPLLMVYWTGLPAMVFGAVSLFASLVTFLVPDTADDSLPNTVKQAEEIGNKKKNLALQGINNTSFSTNENIELASNRNITAL